MVKIRQDRPQRRNAWASLLVALVAAVGTFIGWRLWPAEEAVVARQRDIRDIRVTWECLSGHRFEARGACTPAVCPQGNEPADIVLPCECPRHGRIEAFVRYEPDEAGRPRPAQARFRHGPWRPVDDCIRCPTCNQPCRTGPLMSWPVAPRTPGG